MAERLGIVAIEHVGRVAHEARAPADHKGQNQVLADDALGGRRPDAGRGDDRAAVQRPAPRQGAHQPRQGRGRGVAIGRGDLGASPVARAASARRRPGRQEGGLHSIVQLTELGQGAGPHQLGAAVVLAVGQADPQVEI